MSLDSLNARIERAERIAIGKAMGGQRTQEDDDELAVFYSERRRMYEEETTHE